MSLFVWKMEDSGVLSVSVVFRWQRLHIFDRDVLRVVIWWLWWKANSDVNKIKDLFTGFRIHIGKVPILFISAFRDSFLFFSKLCESIDWSFSLWCQKHDRVFSAVVNLRDYVWNLVILGMFKNTYWKSTYAHTLCIGKSSAVL